MAKLPWFKFFPSDWQKDENLRRCSHAAKGIWIDLICISFECSERGVFATNGKPWPKEDLAVAVGGDKSATLAGIDELLDKGVLRASVNGAYFIKRVVDDERKRKLTKERVEKHRSVTNGSCNANVTPKKRSRNADVTSRSQKSEVRSQNTNKNPPNPPRGKVEIPDDLKEFEKPIYDWLEYKREKGERYKGKLGLNALWSRLRKIDRGKIAESIEFSMAQNYSGIFPVKSPCQRNDDLFRSRDSSKYFDTSGDTDMSQFDDDGPSSKAG